MIRTIKKLTAALFILLCGEGYSLVNAQKTSTIILNVINNENKANLFLNCGPGELSFVNPPYIRITPDMKTDTLHIQSEVPLDFGMMDMSGMQLNGIVYPGDTLFITCDFQNKQEVSFRGKSASVCRFLTSLNRSAGSKGIRVAQFSAFNYRNYPEYFFRIEEKYKYRDSIYKQQKETLPAWYQKFYKADNIYAKSSEMLRMIHAYNSLNTDKLYANPELMLWFRDFPLNNPDAFMHVSYFQYLWQYFLWKNNIFLKTGLDQSVKVTWLREILPDIKKELNEPTREWFLSNVIANYYKDKDYDEVDSAFSLVRPIIKNPELLDKISHARAYSIESKRKKFANAAKEGDRAPSFYLKDSLDVNYSIGNFRGKWALLGFYKSNGSFPLQSLKTYVDSSPNFKEVQMVHIYMDKDVQFWKERISEVSDSGVHLFCKGNWSEILTNLYGLEQFPSFILVDPKGIIQYSGNDNYKNGISVVLNKYSNYGQ